MQVAEKLVSPFLTSPQVAANFCYDDGLVLPQIGDQKALWRNALKMQNCRGHNFTLGWLKSTSICGIILRTGCSLAFYVGLCFRIYLPSRRTTDLIKKRSVGTRSQPRKGLFKGIWGRCHQQAKSQVY